jgi:GMP synthase-like glutamine amidotransferase
MTIHLIQHVGFEGPGAIAYWAGARGQTLAITRPDRGDVLPLVTARDALIVMGGPMGVHDEDEHPWLMHEKRRLADALAADARVLGICLGAQLLAHVLGARVHPNKEKEVGWWPIDWLEAARVPEAFPFLPDSSIVLHWHGDTFELPAGVRHLARSAACENQAFALGERVVGLQFHLEATPQGVQDLVQHAAGDLAAGPFVQSADKIQRDAPSWEGLHGVLYKLLDRWLPAVAGE